MGDVTALMMDVITEKSGHTITPLAVSVCLTPAAPAPLPIPYPVVGSSIEGITDEPMRTKINGAKIGTVGSVIKTCHGNEPGTLKEVVSLNTTGPCFIIMGAPIVLCELGMMGITGSPCISNKAVTVGAGGSASDAGGTGGAGGGGGGGGSGGGDASGSQGPSNGGGAGGGGSNSGASGPGSASDPSSEQCTSEGHPVNVANGRVIDEVIDLSLPGPIPLVWKRDYSSGRRKEQGALGWGWSHSFEEWITDEPRGLVLRAGDGRTICFARVAAGQSTLHRRERLVLTADARGGYSVRSLDSRLTREFAPAGDRAALRSIRDAWGNAILVERDGARLTRLVDTAGREVHVKSREGRVVRLEVRAGGRLEQWVDYDYSAAGDLVRAVNVLGHADTYEYDRFHRMTSATLKTGVSFEYEYAANTGWCARTWGPKGLYALSLVPDLERRTTTIESDEEPKIYTWNADGLVVREETPDGSYSRERAYDDDALLIAEVNGAGEGTQHWYDDRGNKIRTVDAAGNVTAWEYADDLLARRVEPGGVVTQFSHDASGALVGVVNASGLAYALSYDDRGRLTAIHAGAAQLLALEYDGRHNLVAETDACGARTTYAYDELGRPVARTDALGRTTRVGYDRLGQIVSVHYPDGTSTSTSYDERGNASRHVDAMGRVTSMEWGGTGVMTKLTQPDGGVWTFKHTTRERVREVKSPLGETYTFTYDQAGRPIVEKTFDGRVLAYRYGRAGDLEEITYPDGARRNFSYDRLGNIVGDAFPGGEAIYRRDAVGRMIEATSIDEGGRVVTSFERDALGRIVAEGHGDRRVRYEHDARGRRTSRRMPDGATTRYAYDATGALVGVEHEGHALAIERDALGRETRRGAAGRVEIQSRYDAMDRIIEQRATAPAPGGGAPAVLAQRLWRYDAVGRVKRVEDGRWGVVEYGYDRADRLLDVKRGALREAFEYDAVGSIMGALDALTGSGKKASWEVAPGGLLTRTDEFKYTYDKRGRRVVALPLNGAAGERRATEYVWDARDRLREVKLPGGDRVEMSYDALGRRVQKRVLTGTSARTVDFVWDGHTIAADVDSERGTRCFVHEPGSFRPLLQAERGEVFTYVTDHLGMPKELIDPRGVVAWSASHSAWGKITQVQRDPARARPVDTPFRMLGQYADDETGLCYTRFRYFDPDVGRWCSPDPLGLRGGKNLFAFNGSPTLLVDPLGLACRNEAFQQAKKDAGIPRSQSPHKVEKVPMTDRNGKQIFDENHQPIMTTEYHYKRPSDGAHIVIQDHSAGHQYGEGGVGDQGPHFNVRPGSDTRNGHVPGTKDHYPFTP